MTKNGVTHDVDNVINLSIVNINNVLFYCPPIHFFHSNHLWHFFDYIWGISTYEQKNMSDHDEIKCNFFPNINGDWIAYSSLSW